MTNLNGSTVAPPVTVQASILSNYGNDALLPNRLKELAQTIMASQLKNLGLNISVFGKVKTVLLTSYLNNSITCFETPSPSPSPSPSPLPSPSPSPSPFPSAAPCPSPSEEYSYNTDPYHTMSSPCFPPTYPSNSADSDHKEKEMPRSGYRRARAIFYETPLLVQDKGSFKVSALTMTNSLFLSSSTSTSGSMSWFIFSAASFLLVLLSGLW
ncbi:hypothetical protein HPP92_002299 [Vanilla planifolia]|uniref:DUF7036 domain-containing protein n=1 Tax=Vanilla planifolia TaxID=51239 RepID=A0A835RVM1_VANPL|nr:hypothetical protein HPP92_002299 [Vanilla planifolia]